MDIDKKLELLKQLKEVDTPPYLFTRIRQQIDSSGIEEAPVTWKFTFAVIALLILALNISTVFNTKSSTVNSAGIKEVVSSMHLSSTNDLYNQND